SGPRGWVGAAAWGVGRVPGPPRAPAALPPWVGGGRLPPPHRRKVVCPTPNPPATTILTEVMPESAASTGETVSELAKSTQYPFQQPDVRAALSVVGLVDSHQAFHRHVSDQDPRHAQRHLQHRGDLGH